MFTSMKEQNQYTKNKEAGTHPVTKQNKQAKYTKTLVPQYSSLKAFQEMTNHLTKTTHQNHGHKLSAKEKGMEYLTSLMIPVYIMKEKTLGMGR